MKDVVFDMEEFWAGYCCGLRGIERNIWFRYGWMNRGEFFRVVRFDLDYERVD